MRNVVIDQQDCHLEIDKACLLIRHPSFSRPKTLPLKQMDSLVIQSRVHLDSHVLCILSGFGIRVQLIPSRGHGQHCFLTGEVHKDGQRRLLQYALAQNEPERIRWAARIVRLRLRNQRLLLQRLAFFCPNQTNHLQAAAIKIHKIQQRLQLDLSIDSIRGFEGSGSAVFFAAYQKLFATDLAFLNRNRRPPLDPVNVVLSLAYSLLHSIFRQATYECGLDVSIGGLHELNYGRESFVCDLIELRRASIEFWVWSLFEQDVLNLQHFNFSDEAGHLPCLLDKAGRGKFYAAFSQIQDQLLKDARQIVWIFARRLYPDKQLNH